MPSYVLLTLNALVTRVQWSELYARRAGCLTRLDWTCFSRFAVLFLLENHSLNILQIFSHLAPLDLLRLARTTKELRKLLLHRSATSVWKAALSNVEGLPACPEDLSLPFWTNLVFDHHCQVWAINLTNRPFIHLTLCPELPCEQREKMRLCSARSLLQEMC
jgi:hypothetical protein